MSFSTEKSNKGCFSKNKMAKQWQKWPMDFNNMKQLRKNLFMIMFSLIFE